MNDSSSTTRPITPLPAQDDSPEVAQPQESTDDPGPVGVEDQPTVITRRPPMPAQAPSPGEIEPFAPGTNLGHFRLLDSIGGGGMGRVYRAVDTRLGRIVALKVLPPEQAADPDTLLRFRNEARSAARLNHEGIAQVYFVGEQDGAPFIAFEFIEGTNVRDFVNQHGPLPLAEALQITLQVAEALAHAAARNVVHRDIKPSNVLITTDGKVKLIDLGLARMQPLAGSGSDLTASGVTLGTFDYISPEQARDPRNADARSDIYSLGCTLFFMLAGRPPFPEGTVLQKLLQHQGDEPPDIRQFRPELPDEVARVLKRMMAKAPERRYPDPQKLIESLLALADQIGVPLVGPGRGGTIARAAQSPSFWQRHLPWMVPLVTLAAIVLLLHYAWSPPPAGPAGVDRDPWSDPAQSGPAPRWPEERIEGLPAPLPTQGEAARPGEPASGGPAATARQGGSAASGGLQTDLSPGGGPTGEAAAPAGDQQPPSPAAPPLEPIAGTAEAGRGGTPPPAGPARAATDAATGAPPAPGASPAASESTGTAGPLPPVDDQPAGPPVRVVDPHGQTEGAFSSLATAAAGAPAGTVIELHYSGRLGGDQHALRLANADVTIRPGEGFEPILTYRPEQPDPIRYPHRLFSLTATRLVLENVAVEMEIPPEILADDWAVFQLGPGQSMVLRQCSVTIRNTSAQPDVACFRLGAPLGDAPARGETTSASVQPASIALSDCVVRGQASLLRVDDPLAVELDWQNGLLVTSEPLLLARGDDRSPAPGVEIHLSLEHVTAVAPGGLYRWTATDSAPYLPPTQITHVACVFLGSDQAPLGWQEIAGEIDEALSQVVWHGRYNAYNGFARFWTFRPVDPTRPQVTWSIEEWLERVGMEAETEPLTGPLNWRRLPSPNRPVHEHTVSDYALLDGPFGSATEDGSPAGFLWQLLPPLPESPTGGPNPSPPETPRPGSEPAAPPTGRAPLPAPR